MENHTVRIAIPQNLAAAWYPASCTRGAFPYNGGVEYRGLYSIIDDREIHCGTLCEEREELVEQYLKSSMYLLRRGTF